MQVAKTAFLVWLLAFPVFASAEDQESPFTHDRLHTLHAKLDADANGKVSMEEILQALHSTRKSASYDSSPEKLREKDKDNDGKLSLDELMAEPDLGHLPPGQETQGHEESEEDIKSREEARADEKAREGVKFEAADLDKDGLLDAKELAAYHSPETHDHILEITAKWALADKDRDTDGFLTFEEFHAPPIDAGNQTGPHIPDGHTPDDIDNERGLKGPQSHGGGYEGYDEPEDDNDLEDGEEPEEIPERMPEEFPDPEVHAREEDLKLFKRLDENGDGKLDLKEMFDYESGHVYTKEAFDQFMELVDTDNDQHVTVDELQASEKWDTSDAQYYLMEMIPKGPRPKEEL